MNTLEFHRQGDARSASPSIMEGSPAPRDVDAGASPALISQILTIARRRKRVIIASLALCLVIGVVLTLLMTPKFTAATVIEIQRENGSFVNVEGAEPKAGYVDQEFYETQYGLLQSNMLAERVAQDLKLYDNATFFAEFRAAPDWFADGRVKAGASTREQRIRAAGQILLAKFNLRPERLSRLVTITMTTPDAALSQRIINAWATTFIKVTLERRYGATSYARRFLEERLTQLRERLDGSERRLVDYARQEGIVNLPIVSNGPAGSSGERSLASEDLVALNTELASARADRIRAQSRLGMSGGEAIEALNNATIGALRSRRAELTADYARLMTQFEPQYPPAVAVQNQITQTDRSIAREEGRVASTLRQAYESSLEREQDLARRVTESKSDVLNLRQRSIQYNILQRDVDTSRQLYDALLQRYKEIGVAGGVGVNNISVVDEAQLPLVPSSPNLILNLALALAIGLLLGIGGALALEQMDQGISDPSEVEGALGVPLVGTIPKVNAGTAMRELLDRKSEINEAYFSLQTNLAFATTHGMPRSIAITSTRPAEGKSTTSYALAYSIARSQHRVILIDADMRSPSVHSMLERPNVAGLSNYLSGNDNLASLIEETAFHNMSVMFAGPQPPSAPELLSGDRIEKLITELAEQFDYIVFDAPPVMGLADAPLLGSRVEGTVFVMQAGSTHKNMALVAIERLKSAHASMIGVVLTKFDPARAMFGYGYSYGYGHDYGDTSTGGSESSRL